MKAGVFLGAEVLDGAEVEKGMIRTGENPSIYASSVSVTVVGNAFYYFRSRECVPLGIR